MGSRGPIPKRSDQRRRRNKDSEAQTAKAPAASDSTTVEPPRTGKGSSLQAWRDYAWSVGHDVPDGAKRAEIIAMVDAGPPEPQVGEDWHPIAVEWFRSLSASGQSQFFQPSDWTAARYVAESMSRNLNAGRFSAQLFAAVWSAMGELLTTEGARRRARLEIEADGDGADEDSTVTAIDDYRRDLGVV